MGPRTDLCGSVLGLSSAYSVMSATERVGTQEQGGHGSMGHRRWAGFVLTPFKLNMTLGLGNLVLLFSRLQAYLMGPMGRPSPPLLTHAYCSPPRTPVPTPRSGLLHDQLLTRPYPAHRSFHRATFLYPEGTQAVPTVGRNASGASH